MAPKNKPQNIIYSHDNVIKRNSFKTNNRTRGKKQKACNSKQASKFLKIQKEEDEKGESPFIDSNLPYHGFCYTGGDYNYRRMLHLMEREDNCEYYSDKKPLYLLPFLYDQPEGMPCWIRRLDDIVNMNEANVLVFLRGYGEPTDDADLNELRRRLAIAVGIPEDIVNKKFNYVNEASKFLEKKEDENGEKMLTIMDILPTSK